MHDFRSRRLAGLPGLSLDSPPAETERFAHWLATTSAARRQLPFPVADKRTSSTAERHWAAVRRVGRERCRRCRVDPVSRRMCGSSAEPRLMSPPITISCTKSRLGIKSHHCRRGARRRFRLPLRRTHRGYENATAETSQQDADQGFLHLWGGADASAACDRLVHGRLH